MDGYKAAGGECWLLDLVSEGPMAAYVPPEMKTRVMVEMILWLNGGVSDVEEVAM